MRYIHVIIDEIMNTYNELTTFLNNLSHRQQFDVLRIVSKILKIDIIAQNSKTEPYVCPTSFTEAECQAWYDINKDCAVNTFTSGFVSCSYFCVSLYHIIYHKLCMFKPYFY